MTETNDAGGGGGNTKPAAFCSFDVETDGTNPMRHSMRSIGIALFSEDNGLVDTFYMTIEPQVDAEGRFYEPDPRTMRNFWDKYPQQWKEVQDKAQPPSVIMGHMSRWLGKHQRNYTIKWVARPANCDWMWLKTYYETYGPHHKPEIGYYCHDLSSLMRAYELCNNITDKRAFMVALSGSAPYTHNALDDALCQGHMYMNLRNLLDQKMHHNFSYTVNHQGLQMLVTTQTYILPPYSHHAQPHESGNSYESGKPYEAGKPYVPYGEASPRADLVDSSNYLVEEFPPLPTSNAAQ